MQGGVTGVGNAPNVFSSFPTVRKSVKLVLEKSVPWTFMGSCELCPCWLHTWAKYATF